MNRGVLVALPLFALLPQAAGAQQLNATQQEGMALFTQHCGVCHLKPQINAATFGPTLSKDSAGGNDEVMRGVIMDGTPRMPGFKLEFTPPQINAIVAYLRTVPAPEPTSPAPAR
jgi:mono/diheme cytochrome c family protein